MIIWIRTSIKMFAYMFHTNFPMTIVMSKSKLTFYICFWICECCCCYYVFLFDCWFFLLLFFNIFFQIAFLISIFNQRSCMILCIMYALFLSDYKLFVNNPDISFVVLSTVRWRDMMNVYVRGVCKIRKSIRTFSQMTTLAATIPHTKAR